MTVKKSILAVVITMGCSVPCWATGIGEVVGHFSMAAARVRPLTQPENKRWAGEGRIALARRYQKWLEVGFGVAVLFAERSTLGNHSIGADTSVHSVRASFAEMTCDVRLLLGPALADIDVFYPVVGVRAGLLLEQDTTCPLGSCRSGAESSEYLSPLLATEVGLVWRVTRAMQVGLIASASIGPHTQNYYAYSMHAEVTIYPSSFFE